MTKLVELMQRIALNVLESTKPMMIQYGRVISTVPLKVQLSQKVILDKDSLIVRESENTFQAGDTLLLLRDHGGQKYLIYGKKGVL